jgi:hypothetical protein
MGYDIETKMRIDHALKERDARNACHIVQALMSIFDLIDNQSVVVLEALIDYTKNLQRPDSTAPKHRRLMRGHFIEYLQEARREQRKTEQMLFSGVTGREEDKT